jgi:hypothetical protein
MIELNYQVDVRKQSPAAVARAFLDSLGLWRPPAGERTGRVRIGSKIFTEQYILAEMVAQLVEGHTQLAGEVRAGMGGTQICFEALRAGEIDLYPEYSGTGLEVILKRKELLRDSLGGDPARLYGYVSRAFPDRFGVRWLPPLGFNNTYALLMRPRNRPGTGHPVHLRFATRHGGKVKETADRRKGDRRRIGNEIGAGLPAMRRYLTIPPIYAVLSASLGCSMPFLYAQSVHQVSHCLSFGLLSFRSSFLRPPVSLHCCNIRRKNATSQRSGQSGAILPQSAHEKSKS